MRALPWRQRPHSCLESMGLWADTRTRPIYRKGLRPQGLGLPYFFSPAPNRSPGASGPLVVWTAVQEIPYPPVFLKRKPANFLGDRGQSPRRLFASFLHAEKGCGRAFDSLFGRIAFFMRRHTENLFFRSCHKAQAVLWHPLSWRQERGKRTVRGLSPLNPRVALSIFSLRKSTRTPPPEPAYIKRGCGPRDLGFFL